MPNHEKARVGERRTGFCPFHVATVAKTGLQIPKTWPSYRILDIFMYDALGRCNQVRTLQSGALTSDYDAVHSPLSLIFHTVKVSPVSSAVWYEIPVNLPFSCHTVKVSRDSSAMW